MSDVDRLNAALEDRYRIERELGEGGMATVFLADDLKHDRQVAIKVLKPELAAVIGGERFVAEIKTTAALQHPHILPLFDSGSTDGFLYYVMPYVEGESLREKLNRETQLSVDEAVGIAEAVASALHYAHEQGIVHRDIKPANILIHAGEPVVADFGIALAISAAGGGRLTETGMSVGTPHYMSPEQASPDRHVTARSDIYSLACVLYEMLAGEPPHTGSTAQAVLMRILTEEPRDLGDTRKSVPTNVRDAVARALEKLPADRFESAEAFKRALTDERFRYRPEARDRSSTGRPGAPDGPGRIRSTRTLALMAVIALLGIGLGWTIRQLQDGRAGRTAIPTHRYTIEDTLRSDVAADISVHGDVAYEATVEGRQHLRLRRATETWSVEIPNTTGGIGHSFSPDGEWISFIVDREEVRKVQLATGTTVTLVSEGPLGPFFMTEWTVDGTILISGAQGVYRVPDIGGTPERIVEDPSVFGRLLPGGRTLIRTNLPSSGVSGLTVVAHDLETGDSTVIADPGSNAFWSPTGHILYGHPSATIFAVPFDPDRLEVTGPPVPVQEGVFTVGDLSFFALSDAGELVYVGGGGTDVDFAETNLAWLDTDGTVATLPVEPTDHDDLRLSPDGTRIAYTRGGHIHVYDLSRGTDQRLTFEGQEHHNPVWSPDGERVAFAADREEGRRRDIYAKDVDGRTPAEWLGGAEGEQYPAEWLDDGTLVLFSRAEVGAQTDVEILKIGGEPEPTPLLAGEWAEANPSVSPDGSLMAYSSNETGDNHIFVREFPGMGGRWQVSRQPVEGPSVWAPSGDAIFYELLDSSDLVRAELELEPTFRVVRRTVVSVEEIDNLRDIHPDGRRLLVTRAVGTGALTRFDQELMVVANWLPQLRQRLGEDGP